MCAPSKATLPRAANKIWIQNSNSFVYMFSGDIFSRAATTNRQTNQRLSAVRGSTTHAALCVNPCEKRKRIWIGIIYYYYIIFYFVVARICSALDGLTGIASHLISHMSVMCLSLCCIERRRAEWKSIRQYFFFLLSMPKTTAQCFGIVSRK